MSPSEWKVVSLLRPVCEGMNCRSNVGKRALIERLFVRGVFSAGHDRVRERSCRTNITPALE